MSRYFVTGATGFLGQHLLALLLEGGHEVVALQRHGSDQDPSGLTVRLGDVTDEQAVAEAAVGCEGAFHLAGKVSRDKADAEAMYRVHVDGTKATLAGLRKAGVPRVVVVSTSGTMAVSSDPDVIADEESETPTEIITRWPYYRSKLYAEQSALKHDSEELEVVCVNPSLLLGPGDERGSSTEDVRLFLEGKVVVCPAGGIAFVDARDAAAGLLLAMEKGTAGRRYLLNAANMSLQIFFGRLARMADVSPPSLRMPRGRAALAGFGAELLGRASKALSVASPVDPISAEMGQYYWYCDSRRASDELGWQARDPGDTLRDTVDDLRERGAVWPR